MTNLKFFALIHEHRCGKSVHAFYYRPTAERPYPHAVRVAKRLGLKFRGSAGERLTLHPVESDPPDRILSATDVGCRSTKFLDTYH
jgi:hypothetical protein